MGRPSAASITAATKNTSSAEAAAPDRNAAGPEITHRLQWADIVWRNVLIFSYMHIASAYGIYQLVTGEAHILTWCIAYFYAWLGAFGITGGAHRLWAHGAYKANVPMRVFLMLLNCIAFQNDIHEWTRDHRVHHKFTDTNADPHNYSRGFFFAHMGWLMVKKHPDVRAKGASISLADIEQDGIVMFQKKYYLILMPIMSFVVPTFGIGYWLCGESLSVSWHVCGPLRYAVSLHMAWMINSAAHSWGSKPFDAAIKPVDNQWLSLVMHGEAWHNYHHVFPWDYKTSELGTWAYNYTTALIDAFAAIGWAYDLKTVSAEVVRKRALRTGDQTWRTAGDVDGCTEPDVAAIDLNIIYDDHVWGWNDTKLTDEVRRAATIIN